MTDSLLNCETLANRKSRNPKNTVLHNYFGARSQLMPGWLAAIITVMFVGLTPVFAQKAAQKPPEVSKPAGPTAAQPAPPTSPQPQQPSSPTGTEQASALGDSSERSKAVIQHLDAVLRFYHDVEAPIQKVGEPSDLMYREQAVTLAQETAGFAFQSAKAEAVLLSKSNQGTDIAPDVQTQAQRLQANRISVAQRIAALKAEDAELEKRLATARASDIAELQQQREETQGELELQTAIADALGKISTISGMSSDTGFTTRINQLERSAPGLLTGKTTTVAPTLESSSAARSAGVTSQARFLFDLLSARQSIENLIEEVDRVHQQAAGLRTPLIAMLRSTIAQGETLSQQANPPASQISESQSHSRPVKSVHTPAASSSAAANAAALDDMRNNFDSLTASFKEISSASVPLSQELVTLEQTQASLQAWHEAVDEEYKSILRSLLVRVVGIAVALLVIFILGEAWRRATARYVHDVRRRRQLLIVRRLIIGFMSGLVMIFGLVTQFSSLATFAGFITAGLAVGLQTILLSVAAYFFIIGRYGVKVGDRITIAGVTGDVAEVGLVRFYVMELAGSGTDLYPSGRIAVFSNAVLFQAATPLYKQVPGTEYLWHEMTVKLAADVDYRSAVAAMLQSVKEVYEGYRQQVDLQHRQLESWMDTSMAAPGVQSSLQLVDGGPQFWVRFPVLIRQTTEIDDRMTESLLRVIASDPTIKAAVSAPPVIKAAVKG